MDEGLQLADALDVAAMRLIEALQEPGDVPVDEDILFEASVVASGALEHFWDWRESRPDQTLPQSSHGVFISADVVADAVEALLASLHGGADHDTIGTDWLVTSAACEQYERKRLDVATPADFAR